VHDGSRKAVIAAFLANTGIAIAKFIGFAITQSASLLAEAIHSVADAGNQLLLLLGGARARKAATPEHPFGFGRERYFWAFVVALVLFSMGGLFAIYEGISKLRHPHEPENLTVAVTILVAAIIMEIFSFRTAIKESRPYKGKRSWWTFIRRTKNPELPVVLLEDLGALVGLVIALLGVTLARVTHNARFDALGSLTIGVLLVVIAIVLAIEMRGLLLGEAAAPDVQQRIAEALTSAQGVTRVIHIRTEHIGPEEVLVGAKIEVSTGMPSQEVAAVINAAETAARAAVPDVDLVMYLEPDLHDPSRATEA
jgi:cation diffusion facilitator family transporter